MRVLMFGWEFPPHITGGLGTACLGMTRALMQEGVEVTFVLPRLFGQEEPGGMRLLSASELGLNLREEEVLFLREHARFLAIDSYLHPYIGQEDLWSERHQERGYELRLHHWREEYFSFSGRYGANLMEEVARYALLGAVVAQREDFDIIHAHDWLTYGAGIAAREASGRPLVVHVHATEFDRSGENINQAVYDIERHGMHAADRVIAVSNRTRETIISRYGVPPERVVTVHNAVDFSGQSLLGPLERPFPERVVTFLGRITFQKGPEYFVEAAHRVLQRMDNVRFVMAGSGNTLHQMVSRVAQLGMASKFHFAGFLQGEDVDTMYRMSDVYVMPSVSEPFGITPLEAMRNTVPVIISRQSGVAEVLRHAIKVDFWDIDAIADSIYGILSYRALQRFFQRHGAEEVKGIQWGQAARRIGDVYEQLCPT
ncbi:MAG: 4-alpha-glucanotransferase [Bacteroidia bacterium]|nr:MAG: 4-alpha-glucanotransferase [Bacteroidia bacterium]